MRVLFVAAAPMEFRGILARAKDIRTPRIGAEFARQASLVGNEVLLVTNGMGSKRAAGAVDAGCAFQPQVIVSTGFCGALDEALQIGDVVAATAVSANGRLRTARGVEAAHRGVICSIDHVAQTAGEKRRLRETGACAVEMEAGAVAEKADGLGLPFYCVRAVTDLANETMANDFNRALRSDGHLDTMDILRGALRFPTSRVAELFRLRSRCVRAAEALGEFFVGCRF
jgi:nucleoside phosphorylase